MATLSPYVTAREEEPTVNKLFANGLVDPKFVSADIVKEPIEMGPAMEDVAIVEVEMKLGNVVVLRSIKELMETGPANEDVAVEVEMRFGSVVVP